MRYKLIIQYDGTDFHGWQKQPGFRTVQQTLEEALKPLSPDDAPVCVHGSGRTDAGVHAEGQVAHFDLNREMSPTQLRRALNGHLTRGDVRILDASAAASDFDARRSAIRKEYRYRIWNAEVMNPLMRRYAAHIRQPLDIDAMREAAKHFVGAHDFASFSANPAREIETTVREIFGITLVGSADNRIEIRIAGNGFLYKMARSISGFLMAVGFGRETPESVPEVIATKTRTSRVETAPPQGLTLWQVWYDDSCAEQETVVL